MQDWHSLRDPHERIRWARLNRTHFVRPTDAARSLGVKPGTYRTWEIAKADGGRAPMLSELQHLARKFNISWRWLLTGEGVPDATAETEMTVMAGGIAERLSRVSALKREDALRAINGILDAFAGDPPLKTGT